MNHGFDFDPTYGYDERELRSVPCPAAPADFESFWRHTYERARQVDPRPTRTLVRSGQRYNLFEVEFDAWNCPGDGVIRLGGWITVPASGGINAGVVVGHGYGGRGGPELSPPITSAAVIYPCARGFNRSAFPDLPNSAAQHVLHGIGSREEYLHRGCVIDLWSAAWALTQLEPASAQWMTYSGESFGGGIGALALPWEPRFQRAFLDFPSFGHHPLRLTMPCAGSGEAVRQSGGKVHLPTLQYFDAATAAAHTRIPVMVAAAVFDPAVPPPGQFAIYNCLAGEKKLFVRRAAHFDWTGGVEENAKVQKLASDWLSTRP